MLHFPMNSFVCIKCIYNVSANYCNTKGKKKTTKIYKNNHHINKIFLLHVCKYFPINMRFQSLNINLPL